jgi:ABC-type transport system involved in multi-copper enzyme maturation permease subunit
MRILLSGLRKLQRRPATWLTFGILTGLLVMIIVAVAATGGDGTGPGGPDGPDPLTLVTFPLAYQLILGFIVGLGGLFAVTYGAAVAGSEWSWGTLKMAVARGESRSRYMLLTFGAVTAYLVAGLLFSFVIGVAAAFIGANLAGVPTDGMNNPDALGALPEQFGRGWFAMAEQGALGFAVATLARSQLAGIGVGIAFYFGEAFAGIFLPDIVRYMPFNVATSAVGLGGAGFGAGPDPLGQETAMLLVGAWLIGSLIVAAVFTERAEITG